MINVIPVILCGGAGTRLWPLSRTGFPKQFLCLTGDASLFQQAAHRLDNLNSPQIAMAPPIIVTGEEHRFIAAEQLRETGIGLGRALLEPMGRNTAPALTLAALAAREAGSDPVLVVVPADQTVADTAAFSAAMSRAIHSADSGNIVILGVAPDRAETGYGYIQVDAFAGLTDTVNVRRFVEKPDAATARSYLEDGGYFWNAGMFVLKGSVWLNALEQFRPDILEATVAAWAAREVDAQFVRPGKSAFAAIPAESIDYAVMEHCPGTEVPIVMVPLDAGWNDLGAWDAVWNVLPKDDNGNAHVGDVLTTNTRNSLVHATSRLVTLVGVDDLIVVETPDAVLVSHRRKCQDVKDIVGKLVGENREEHLLHRKVDRPWGWYDSIDEGGRFKVKRILVNPNASLSLQMHHHRAEHWIVVSGTAEITNGDKVILLSENESTYIPLGEMHRLKNPGTIPLEII